MSQPRIVRGLALLAAAALLGTAGCDLGAGQAAPGSGASTPSRTTPSATASAAPSPSSPSSPSLPSANEAASPTSAATPTAPSTSTPTPTPPSASPTAPSPSTSATPAAVLSPGDTGEQVRELQHRLQQLEWFPGPMTGTYGDVTVDAVKGFQDKREFEVTGTVDQQTWTSLVDRTRTPTRNERHNVLVAGPAILERGDSGDRVRELQARLKQLAWFSGDVTGSYGSVTVASVEGFQGKRAIPVTGEVDQRTWDRLTAMTRTPTSDEKLNKIPKPSATGLDSRCLTGRAMCISKRTNSLVWVVDGEAQLRFDVRFGSAELPTREGSFAVGWKSRNHVSSLYHTKMPYAMFFSGGQAVHYSPDFAARGYSGASHGCVNVRNLSGIQSLFSQARVGDKVIVYS